MLKIGSHVSLKAKEYFLGSVKEALSYGSSALMIYTGAPQNTRRKPVEELKIEEGIELLKEHNIDIEDVVVHAPYIINLGNTVKPETYQLAVEFLKKEIARVEQIGVKNIVLHPGAHVGEGAKAGLDSIIKGLNEVLEKDQKAIICLETMAGKGSECGRTFEEIKYIIDGVKLKEKLGVCLDTCHINDAGYDLNNVEVILDEFDRVIGLDRIKVLHINDSKNTIGAHKDRHENIGYGTIGFDNLLNVIYNPRLSEDIVRILETPYVDNKTKPPYKEEIAMIRNKKFNNWIKEED